MRTPPLLADFSHARPCKPFCENSLTLPIVFAAVDAVGMCVNGQRGGAVGNDVCGLWESWQLFHRAVNICFPSAERPFSTFPIAENSVITHLYIAFPQERIYNKS